jgi:hypothetical protein
VKEAVLKTPRLLMGAMILVPLRKDARVCACGNKKYWKYAMCVQCSRSTEEVSRRREALIRHWAAKDLDVEAAKEFRAANWAAAAFLSRSLQHAAPPI